MLRLIEFTKEVLAQNRVRLMGVCFGHQIIGQALGALVVRGTNGFELSVIELDLTARGRELLDGKDVLVRLSLSVLLGSFLSGKCTCEIPGSSLLLSKLFSDGSSFKKI